MILDGLDLGGSFRTGQFEFGLSLFEIRVIAVEPERIPPSCRWIFFGLRRSLSDIKQHIGKHKGSALGQIGRSQQTLGNHLHLVDDSLHRRLVIEGVLGQKRNLKRRSLYARLLI